MLPLRPNRRALPLLLLVIFAAETRAVGLAGQRAAASCTLAALPEPLRGFYATREDAVLERATEPDGAWRRQPRFRQRDQWHYLMIDAAAGDPSAEARNRAASAFPSDRSKARALLRKHGIRRGGTLIWSLGELVDQLQAAFAEGRRDDVVALTGYVIHFATDASDPFCATRNRRGAESGNLDFGSFEMGDLLFAHQDVVRRVGWELIRQNAERYRTAIDPATIRYELSVDVPNATLEWMIASLEDLEELCTSDRRILERMGVSDAEQFLARKDEYYQLLDASCSALCIDTLRRSASLATTLIVTAWTRAGSPELNDPAYPPASDEPATATKPPDYPTRNPTDRTESPPEDPTPSPVPSGELVASKNSKVYHRPDCPHARRISEKNLVRYDSRAAAERSGKRPCRTCKP